MPTKPPTARPPVRPTAGFTSLEANVAAREDGLRQVRAGVTTVEEVLRVTQG